MAQDEYQVKAPAQQAPAAAKSIIAYARVTLVTKDDVTDNKYSRLLCDLQDVQAGIDKAFNGYLLKHIDDNSTKGHPIYVTRDPKKDELKVAGKKIAFENNAIYKLTLTSDPNVLIGGYIVTSAVKK